MTTFISEKKVLNILKESKDADFSCCSETYTREVYFRLKILSERYNIKFDLIEDVLCQTKDKTDYSYDEILLAMEFSLLKK